MLYFLFPVKIKYLVLGYGAIEFFGTMGTFAGTPAESATLRIWEDCWPD
jgi:hypothetical protein